MEFRISRSKMLGYMIGCVGFVLLGLWLIGLGALEASIAGWLSIVFFGFGIVVLTRQLFNSSTGAAVVINELGIHDRRSKIGFIPWNDVSSVWVGEVRSQRFLCIETYSDSHRPSSFTKTSNAILGFPAITVGFQGLNPGLNAALDYLRTIQPSKFHEERTPSPA